MVSGTNRKEKWSGAVRYREPEDAGTPVVEGSDIKFYDWKLSFCNADTQAALYDKIKETIKFLTSTGKIIGGNSDPIIIEHTVTNIHTRTLEEFEEEVKDSEFSEEKHVQDQVREEHAGESGATKQEG